MTSTVRDVAHGHLAQIDRPIVAKKSGRHIRSVDGHVGVAAGKAAQRYLGRFAPRGFDRYARQEAQKLADVFAAPIAELVDGDNLLDVRRVPPFVQRHGLRAHFAIGDDRDGIHLHRAGSVTGTARLGQLELAGNLAAGGHNHRGRLTLQSEVDDAEPGLARRHALKSKPSAFVRNCIAIRTFESHPRIAKGQAGSGVEDPPLDDTLWLLGASRGGVGEKQASQSDDRHRHPDGLGLEPREVCRNSTNRSSAANIDMSFHRERKMGYTFTERSQAGTLRPLPAMGIDWIEIHTR